MDDVLMSSRQCLLWLIVSAPSPDNIIAALQSVFYQHCCGCSFEVAETLQSDTLAGVMLSFVVGGAAGPNWTGEPIRSSTFNDGACAKLVHAIKYKLSKHKSHPVWKNRFYVNINSLRLCNLIAQFCSSN